MKPIEVEFANPQSVLPGAQFADAYQMIIEGQRLDPLEAAKRAVYGAPAWINRLLWLRNQLVRPFGLKPGAEQTKQSTTSVGIFPIIESRPDCLVLGLDDRHLDFRLLVDIVDIGNSRQSVTVSTAVKTHNALGSAYLTIVKPFHRIIVPVMLRQVLKT
jgi:hypothetical protein